VGNIIQLENGQSGQVQDIGWRTTVLRQLSGNLIILPNSKLASNVIVNFTNPHPDLTVSLQLAVPLTADLQQVEELTREVAESVGRRLLSEKAGGKKHKDLVPLIRYLSYGEASINLSVNLPFPVAMDGGQVRHELFKALHARFLEEHISLPFPQSVVHLEFPENYHPPMDAVADG
jgi:small-conductance mechanosensitive channel